MPLDRHDDFHQLVLAGLWAIIKNLYGRHTDPTIANDFRLGAIYFGDKYGEQTTAAYEYRRAVTYRETLS